VQDIPLEMLTSFLSIVGLIMIFRQYLGYKKVIDVVKDLNQRKEKRVLSSDDKQYIKDNLKEYSDKLVYQSSFNKLMYPILVIIGAVFTMFVPFSQAVIHFNVLIVAFIYVTIIKMHCANIVKFLEELSA